MPPEIPFRLGGVGIPGNKGGKGGIPLTPGGRGIPGMFGGGGTIPGNKPKPGGGRGILGGVGMLGLATKIL